MVVPRYSHYFAGHFAPLGWCSFLPYGGLDCLNLARQILWGKVWTFEGKLISCVPFCSALGVAFLLRQKFRCECVHADCRAVLSEMTHLELDHITEELVKKNLPEVERRHLQCGEVS